MTSLLHRELRQSGPFASREEAVFLALLRTAEVLLQGEVEVLRPADLSFAQYNVLRILRGAGGEGLACGDIAARMVTRDPDITRLLDRLERRGLVERSRDARDRRVVIARATDAGLALLASLDAPVARVHRDQLRHMTPAQLDALSALLDAARTPTA